MASAVSMNLRPSMTLGTREILVFEAGGRLFGLDLGDVECVVPAIRPVPLPHAPDGFEGIINLRGIAVAVLDLRAWFGDAPRDIQLDDLLIVLHAGTSRVALHVERAHGVVTISPSDIQPAQSPMPSARYFRGVVMIEGGILLLPDVASFLSAAEHVALPEATAA